MADYIGGTNLGAVVPDSNATEKRKKSARGEKRLREDITAFVRDELTRRTAALAKEKKIASAEARAEIMRLLFSNTQQQVLRMERNWKRVSGEVEAVHQLPLNVHKEAVAALARSFPDLRNRLAAPKKGAQGVSGVAKSVNVLPAIPRQVMQLIESAKLTGA